MASLDTGGGRKKKGQPQRINTRVDFTPMVDMNMLLLTFFMFCTTLSKPQVMDIAMPMPDEDVKDKDKPDTKLSQAITIILGANDKVYYYTGMPDYDDYTTLKETTYPSTDGNGFRQIIMERNAKAIAEMRQLREEKRDGKVDEAIYEARRKEIRGDKDNQVVTIKATEQATYKNLVDAIDEMAICSIGRYAVVDMADGDDFLLENFFTKGEHGQSVKAPK